MAWSFDPKTRRFTSQAGDVVAPPLCPHLSPTLHRLLEEESTVLAVLSQAWSEIDLDVTLDHGPSPHAAPVEVSAGTPVQPWANHDPHYPLLHGLICSACHQSIGWPHPPPGHLESVPHRRRRNVLGGTAHRSTF